MPFRGVLYSGEQNHWFKKYWKDCANYVFSSASFVVQ